MTPSIKTIGLDILYVGMLPPHPGGSGISWAQLLAGLAARGHRIRAVAPITANSLTRGDQFAERTPELRVSRFVVPHYYTSPNIPASSEYRALEHREIRAALLRLVAEERPDLIIIGRESFALHVPDLAVELGIPSVQGIRGNTTIAILNGAYPPELASETLAGFRKATLLVSAAMHMAAGLRDLGIGNVITISNAVDVERFRPAPKSAALRAQLGLRDDSVVVMHVSNLKNPKRPMDVVLSAVTVLRRNPRVVYVVVGDGVGRPAMEEACRRQGIADRVRFVGWVEYAMIPEYLNLADVVVMPSATEGLSRVYLETQACGRVLVASDIASAREVVTHGETGLLFRLANIDDLTDKVLMAGVDQGLRARLGERARASVQTRSLDAALTAYEGVMHDIVQASPAASAAYGERGTKDSRPRDRREA